MSTETHVKSLRDKHAQLASKIEEAQRAPGSDDADITQMKKEKLQLKEEIARLSGE